MWKTICRMPLGPVGASVRMRTSGSGLPGAARRAPRLCALASVLSSCSATGLTLDLDDARVQETDIVPDASSDAARSSPDASADAALPACSWAAKLDRVDAAAGACRAARVLLSCGSQTGAMETCLSDDPSQCPTADAHADCHEQCRANEYGVACGSPNPRAIREPPPAGCRSVAVTPGGVVFYCCPCGRAKDADLDQR